MTTDLQRMHQDEWLADLLSTEDAQGVTSASFFEAPLCVLGRARILAAFSLFDGQLREEAAYARTRAWLGISRSLLHRCWMLNDGSVETGDSRSFAEIASWFKEQRDAYDGDLSAWGGER